jgi:2-keto-3-deoxy-L-rhamnonate aldolase RhmA
MSATNLKQRIRNGEHVFGVSVSMMIPRESLAARVEENGYDFVAVDSQHSAFSEERLVDFCNMADTLDIPVNFRIKHTRNAYLVGNYLDLGPSGIEVPQVELEMTVDEAVDAFYYPQQGIRSWGGAARKNSAGTERLEYADWWNNYGMLWMQIESIEAVTHARRLAKSGVDCLSFGPTDLTFSMESHPNHALQTVDACVQYVAKELEGSSTTVCFRNGNPSTREKYADMGVTVFLE